MPMSTEPSDALHTLRYHRPASLWTDALPVGNGLRAAMCEGRVGGERLLLNDTTAWSGPVPGAPESGAADDGPAVLAAVRAAVDSGDLDRAEELALRQQTPWAQAFLPFGFVELTLSGTEADAEPALERTLDLRTGIAVHAYSVVGAGRVRHETWADAVTGALAHRITCDEPVAFDIRLDGPFPSVDHGTAQDAGWTGDSAPRDTGSIAVHWHLPIDVPPGHAAAAGRIRYDETRGRRGAVVVRADTAMDTTGGVLRTAPATAHLLTIGTATTGADGDAVGAARAVALAGADADAHIVFHRALYDRCGLELPTPRDATGLDTDERVVRAQQRADHGLAALAFHYGRYLLMSSSRPGGLPANLQGIWNADLPGPWSSGYTTNINLQMAYWPAETTGLPECHEPLLDFISRHSAGAGAAAARHLYGADGWVLHHNTDPWGHAAPVGESVGDPSWSTWPMGGVWLSLHLWERWLFDGDSEALRTRTWPVLERTARFALSWIQSDGERAWTSPSTSPEHRWLDADGVPRAIGLTATMDAELFRALSAACNQAAAVLGRNDGWVTELRALVDLLPPLAVSRQGRIQEWDRDVPDAEPEHRHLSHLVGLFPLDLISPDSAPQLAEAARASIIARGVESTGWALAWRALMWARLRDGERVGDQLRMLLRPALGADLQDRAEHRGGVYRNLFSAHPPFQIDGNLGFTAAVAEALVQSRAGELRLLPALPDDWTEGSIHGVRARGGVTVDVAWASGRLREVTLHGIRPQRVRVHGPGLPELSVTLDPDQPTTIETKEQPW